MLRRLLFVLGLAGLGALLMAPSASAQRGGTCTLEGTANFTPGLTATPSAVNYTFSGTLSNCQSTGSASGGTLTAAGSSTGSGLTCASGTSAGTTTISWDNGNSTTESFTTTSAGALVIVQATATSSTEPAIAPGDEGLATLLFQTQSPQDCTTPAGLSSADFTGQIVSGGFSESSAEPPPSGGPSPAEQGSGTTSRSGTAGVTGSKKKSCKKHRRSASAAKKKKGCRGKKH